MNNEWVVLELSSRSDGEDPDLIVDAIRKQIRGAEVFVPAAITQIGDDKVTHYLVEGYAFVRLDEPESKYYKLENSRYVSKLLKTSKRLSTISASEIERMQLQVAAEAHQGICVGDTVCIVSGPYRNIEATVIEDIPEEEQVQVYVQLRSKQSIVTLPRSFLQVVSRAPLSPMATRLMALRSWSNKAKPILLWAAPPIISLLDQYSQLDRIQSWTRKGKELFAFVMGPRSLDHLNITLHEYERLQNWVGRGNLLYSFLFFDNYRLPARLSEIEAQQMELEWFTDVIDRGERLKIEIASLERKAARKRKTGDVDVIDNIIVDGHNLAFRCFYAPGMADLTDEKGRPTGMILGFLRSLGALQKRYPDAKVIVTWDGSSQRRKAQFGAYKANRKAHKSPKPAPDGERWEPMEYLRKILPELGVLQAWNSKEEADDVIASLTRNTLKSRENLVFSSDRDFLQLVTSTTTVLVPAQGTRKELFFDEALVKKQYGVEPNNILQLRAMFGDPSDNIPGVPRVPKKVMTQLIQAHGSVEGVYASKLTGVTRSQYERLKTAEPQVKINLEIMALLDVAFETLDPDVDVDSAAARLRDVSINPDPILRSLLGRTSGYGDEDSVGL